MAVAAEFVRLGAAVVVHGREAAHGRDRVAAECVAAAIIRDDGKAMAVISNVTNFVRSFTGFVRLPGT